MSSKSIEVLLKENEILNSKIADLEKLVAEHKQLDEMLTESEEKYKSLYENAPLSYQSLNDDGSFRDVNPAWLRTLGYERAEVIGKFFKDFLHPEWQPHFEKNFPAFKKRGYVHDVQFKIRHKDGHYIDISFEGCIGYYPDGSFKQTYCVFQDITASKLSEEALKESEEKFRSLFEFSPLGKSITGIDGSIKINKAFSEILGYSLDELKEKKWQEITHPDDIQESSNIVKALLDGKVTNANYEKRYIHKNGNLIWTEVTTALKRDKNNQPEYFLTSINDITNRKKENEAQEKQNAYIKMILDNLPIGIATNEIDSMKVTYMNRKFSEIYGWPEDEFPYVGNFFEKVFPNLEYREQMQTKILADISSGDIERMNWDNLKITTKAGDQRIVHASNIPLPNQNIMVSTVQDITKRKLAEEKLQNSEERFKLAMKAATDGLYDWNLETNEIYYSPGWKKMLGYEENELPNDFSIWETNTDTEDVKKSWELQQKVISKEIDRFVIEFKMRHKQGHWVDILSRAEAIFDENGKAIRLVGTHSDITLRKQAEEKLIDSNEKYLNLMDSLGVGVVLHAPDTSIILSNPMASEILGISHEQMQGKKAIDPEWTFVRNDGTDMPIEEYPVNKALKLNKSFSEYIIGIKRPDRKYITWVNINASLVFDNNNIKYVTISFKDITEQKQAEEELKNHQKYLEELVKERTKELDEKNKKLNNSMKVFVGRELTIRDLQKRIKALEGK